MTLELKINGKDVLFVSKDITALLFRKAIKLKKEQEYSTLNEDLLDKLVLFVCEVFGMSFTVQQFYEGIDRKKVFPIINRVLLKVLNGDYNTHTRSQ